MNISSIFKHHLYRLRWWLADHTPYLPKAPINIDIELAGKCNLACTMCPYGTGDFDESKQGMMDEDMAIDILTEAKELGVKAIKFNFRGEPGLHKSLSKLIRIAKEMGFVDVFINTNLLSFSFQRLEELIASGIDKIIVSVDGADEESYEKIRVGGSFSRLRQNIYNTWMGILHRRVCEKNPTPKLILQMVSDKPVDLKKSIPWADEYRYVQVQDRGQGIQKKQGERKRCPQPRQRLVVAWDGTIFPCCSNWDNEFPLGNFHDITLKEAWNGEKMSEIRQISTDCTQFPCKDCQVAGSYK